jgi:DNA-binding transcriptional LysR family regulator
VLAGEADLGFGDIRPATENPDFVVERVRAGPTTSFCASDHPLAGRASVDFQELIKYPWTGPSFAPATGAGMPRDELPCGAFHRETGRFHPRIMVESFASAKQIVLAGAALSAGFPFQIERELASGDLVLMPAQFPFLTIDYGFILKRGRALSPAATAFMDLAREVERAKGGIGGERRD